NKENSGVFTGAYAINPVNQKKVPIWISDYVLASYGTGAIMAVPAHDQRDYEFAKKFGIEIIQVLAGGSIEETAMVEDGLHINSEFLDGLNKDDAINMMIAWLQEHEVGQAKINFRLREWIFARQRYWGEPIPVIHFEDGSMQTLSTDELPLTLPVLDDYKGVGGLSPLCKADNWVNGVKEGKSFKRETNTMPGSAGSSWYFLRYIDPNNTEMLADPKLLAHWMPVDLYVGGAEHAVGHLLYSRMWNQFLYDKGIVKCKEPFKKLFHQGMILGENGEKMSKSRGNVVNPDIIVEQFGADTLRVYEMFMGPLEASKPWSEKGVEGARKWLDRVWRLFMEMDILTDENDGALDYSYHFTVKKVTTDIDTLNMNTAISQMMIFINDCYKHGKVYREYGLNFIKMINCFAPHFAEEIYQQLTNEDTIAYAAWPTYDESKIVLDSIEVAVQVNGKLRGKFDAKTNEEEEVLKQQALDVPNVKTFIEGKEIVKMFVIKGRVINIVVK
ncbi:MAG: leucine--tRNA ligase, partial [Erysipelotrichaceae bacterium]